MGVDAGEESGGIPGDAFGSSCGIYDISSCSPGTSGGASGCELGVAFRNGNSGQRVPIGLRSFSRPALLCDSPSGFTGLRGGQGSRGGGRSRSLGLKSLPFEVLSGSDSSKGRGQVKFNVGGHRLPVAVKPRGVKDGPRPVGVFGVRSSTMRGRRSGVGGLTGGCSILCSLDGVFECLGGLEPRL